MSIVSSLAQARELRCTAARHDLVYNSAHVNRSHLFRFSVVSTAIASPVQVINLLVACAYLTPFVGSQISIVPW